LFPLTGYNFPCMIQPMDNKWIDVRIGANMRKRRKAMGLRLYHVADQIGVSIAAVSKWEVGETSISASTLYDVAHILNVRIGYFFDGITGE
jgi:transcriptional regulator with XRE-family HTH domain